MSKGTIFFDYDGTLHDSMRVYGPAFRLGYDWLVENGYAPEREFDDDWISHWLGYTTTAMWTTFMPDLDEEVWREAAHIVGAEMDRLSESGVAALFDGVPEALTTLKERGYTLAFLSNCRCNYRDAHRRYHGLDQWLDTYTCAGDYPGLTKWEMYQAVADDGRHPRPHVMVGDRFHDIEVATKGDIPAIGCAFGYGCEGELDAATVIIDTMWSLPDAVEEVLS